MHLPGSMKLINQLPGDNQIKPNTFSHDLGSVISVVSEANTKAENNQLVKNKAES
jgi:hypothetical protein